MPISDPNHENNEVLPQSVALLDVDDTLVTGNAQSNEPLLEELEKSGVTHVYLFTNMSPEDIQKAVTDNSYLARDELVRKLEERGFTVHGVITPIDPVYNQGLGAPYRDIFLPQYERCGNELTDTTLGEDIEYKIAYTEFKVYSLLQNVLNETIQGNANSATLKESYKASRAEIQATFNQLKAKNLTEEQKQKVKKIEDLFGEIDTAIDIDSSQPLVNRIQEIAKRFLGESNWFTTYYQPNAGRPAQWDKGAMYTYFLANKPEWVQGCICFDDRKECLDTATEVNQKINPQFSLKTVKVNFKQSKNTTPDNPSYYEGELSQFTKEQFTKASQNFLSAQTQKRQANNQRYQKVGLVSTAKKELESDSNVLLIAKKISDEIDVLSKKDGESRSGKVGESDDNSEIALLTTTLLTATAALKDTNEKTLKTCLACAEKLDGTPSLGKKLLGLLLAFVGVLGIAAGITLSVAVTAATFGLAAPLSVPAGVGIASSGAVLAGGGTFLFFNGCRKGLSNSMVKLAEALEEDMENKKTNSPSLGGEKRV